MIPTTNSRPKLNFVSIAAQENTFRREQAIFLNFIEGIAQKEYIIVVDEIISPKIILFVSEYRIINSV